MKVMIHYLKKHPWLLLGNVICAFGFLMTELGLPTLFAQMVDGGVLQHDKAMLYHYAIIMTVMTVVGVALNIGMSFFISKITTTIIQEIRSDVFHHVMTYSHENYDNIGISSLITRLTNDAYQVMMFLNMMLRMGLLSPLMLIGSMVMIYHSSARLSVLVWCALPVILVGVVIISKLSRPMSEKQQENLDRMNQYMGEQLTGQRVIRAFANESFMEQRFNQVNDAYKKSSTRLYLLMSTNQPLFMLIFDVIVALVLWLGAKQISFGHLAIGNYMAMIEYMFHALYSTLLFATIFMMYPRANVSALRIKEAMNEKNTLKLQGKYSESDAKGTLNFDHVTFKYPGQQSALIQDVSFDIHPGERVAFVGSTGSGKSSLVQLLPRFYDVTDGQILLNGHDIQTYDLQALRQCIGYVPQKARLFSGTIASNLRFGCEEASDDDLWRALDIAQATDFVKEKEGQLEAEVLEGGTNFSGGQRQRLAIARALVRRPYIYLFDDSFSALDVQTDAKLQSSLRQHLKDEMVLIVSQRIASIMDADRIIVLDKGRIVGQGTHDTLMQTNETYRSIVATQLTSDEMLTTTVQ